MKTRRAETRAAFPRAAGDRPRTPRCRPWLETLEGRLTPSGAALDPISEDPQSNPGTLVRDLIARSSPGAPGVAVTDVDDANGTWQFAADGNTWVDLGPVGPDRARLLFGDADTRLRFVPDRNFDRQAGLQFRAWGGAGSEGAVADTLAGTGFGREFLIAAVVVEPVNDPPTPLSDELPPSLQGKERFIPVEDLLANDAAGPANEGGQTLAVVAVEGVRGGTVSLADGLVRFVPEPGFTGPASFAYVVRDGAGGLARGIARFSVLQADPKPGGPGGETAKPVQTDEDVPADVTFGPPTATGVLAITDVDDANGTWQFSRDNGTTWAAVPPVSPLAALILPRASQARLRFIPDANFNGVATLQFRDGGPQIQVPPGPLLDTDAFGFGPLQRVTVHVRPVNDPPTAFTDQLGAIGNGSPVVIPPERLLANDNPGPENESGQRLSIVSVESLVGGQATLTDAGVVFTPTPGYAGPARFRYVITDDGNLLDGSAPLFSTGVVTFDVVAPPTVPANAAPVALDDAFVTLQDQPLTGSVLLNDGDGDAPAPAPTPGTTGLDPTLSPRTAGFPLPPSAVVPVVAPATASAPFIAGDSPLILPLDSTASRTSFTHGGGDQPQPLSLQPGDAVTPPSEFSSSFLHRNETDVLPGELLARPPKRAFRAGAREVDPEAQNPVGPRAALLSESELADSTDVMHFERALESARPLQPLVLSPTPDEPTPTDAAVPEQESTPIPAGESRFGFVRDGLPELIALGAAILGGRRLAARLRRGRRQPPPADRGFFARWFSRNP